jgi:hypothetical protein
VDRREVVDNDCQETQGDHSYDGDQEIFARHGGIITFRSFEGFYEGRPKFSAIRSCE